jgi:hypothetical protein
VSATEYAAECFWPGVTEAALQELDARIEAVEAEGVRYRGSMLLPTDEVVFCFFDGTSADAVRAVAEQAAIPFERIVQPVRGRSTTRED